MTVPCLPAVVGPVFPVVGASDAAPGEEDGTVLMLVGAGSVPTAEVRVLAGASVAVGVGRLLVVVGSWVAGMEVEADDGGHASPGQIMDGVGGA